MKIDILSAEIGSTTTVVNAFTDINTDNPKFIGQGQSFTTVTQGDVTKGLNNAYKDLKAKLMTSNLEYEEFFATSSAAGGLRMTVHGLVHDMTVKAAKEAALGAGANIKFITSGKMEEYDIKKLKQISPSIILISGGVNYGERETALYNAKKITKINEIKDIPVIYAGNLENQDEIKELFNTAGRKVYIVDNVYPKIDQLNVAPTRKKIQEVFEEHITKAPGMDKVRNLVNRNIMPTPGAVMKITQLLEKEIGDLVVVDVGGATTDVHSVTLGSDNINAILISPEPMAKRTVEGDIGVFINAKNIIDDIPLEELSRKTEINIEKLQDIMANYKPIPKTKCEKNFIEYLTLEASKIALKRHVGKLRYLYGASGKRTIAEGKDLTNVKYVIGTGGALTRLEGINMLKQVIQSNGDELLPSKDVSILIDRLYIMASLGVISDKYPQAAIKLLMQSIGLEKV
jgi:uncharacterized protein (TIGR01319 family)